MEESKVVIVNRLFRSGIKSDIQTALDKVVLTDRQKIIVQEYFMDHKPVTYIADNLCVCPMVISKEISSIRDKIYRILQV